MLTKASLLGLAVALCFLPCCRHDAADGRSSLGTASAAATFSARVRLSTCGLNGAKDTMGQVFGGFLRDGRIFVSDGLVPEIREYDLTGRMVDRFGRRGTDPGEFASVRWIASLGPDSLIALDGAASRVSVFDRLGRYTRSFQLRIPQFGQAEWIEEYGTGLAYGFSRGFDARELNETAPARDSFFVAFTDRSGHSDGEATLSLPPIGGRWWRRRTAAYGLLTQAILDGPQPLIATRDGVLLVASSDTQTVERWTGRAWSIISLTGQNWSNGVAADAPDVRFRLYNQLVAGTAGKFWLGDFRVGSDGRRTWRVFGPNGQLQSVVRLAQDFTLWQVDGNELFGKRTQNGGAECIEVLELTRRETEE